MNTISALYFAFKFGTLNETNKLKFKGLNKFKNIQINFNKN